MSSHYALPDTLPPVAADAETLGKALEALIRRRPELSAVIAPFASLFTASRAADAELADWTPVLPKIDPEKLSQGVPWLATDDLSWMNERAANVAWLVLPEIGRQFPSVAGECDALISAIEEERLDLALLARKLLDNDATGLAGHAKELGVRPGMLALAVREVSAPLLRRAASFLTNEAASAYWDRGCCPACGSLPSAAFLARRNERDAEYLVGGGGQRVLLCSRCDNRWTTKRVMCPVCETEEPESLAYEKVTDGRGERVYFCKACKSYLPCVDLRETIEVETLEIEPLGLVHLDIMARGKGFAPAAATPWNALGGEE